MPLRGEVTAVGAFGAARRHYWGGEQPALGIAIPFPEGKAVAFMLFNAQDRGPCHVTLIHVVQVYTLCSGPARIPSAASRQMSSSFRPQSSMRPRGEPGKLLQPVARTVVNGLAAAIWYAGVL